ncbi:multiple sugar transport system substrate-binding protein [Streptacidiphilus sp. BW17]|uniref:ABC transporter substrate-binding protein n=1 Tax=Streptacidiphilus sp. BW17 TaxID=3156274 RepID=UPI003510D793
MRSRRLVCTAALTAAALTALAACGSGSSAGGAGGSSGKPVNITFWGWAPGYDKSVALFNATHHDVHVTFQQTASGSGGGYAKMLTAVKAGSAPCLAQVGYETLPTFAAAGALQDVSTYANASRGEFVPWTWNQVSIDGQVYGVPVDTGPEAMFYRTDLFAKYKLPVPTTWAQFESDAEKFHAADPANYLTTTPQDAYDLAGLAWQNGAKWFGTAGDQWQVSTTDAATQQVAAYWQTLLDRHLAKSEPTLDVAWFDDLNAGHVATLIGAVWNAPLIAQNLPKLAGKWAVAPMPQWTAGAKAAGNNGGSATAVLKGCDQPQAATEFATWMSTDNASVTNLIENTGIYPAATSGLDLPAANATSAYYGGSDIYPVFKEAAAQVNTSWQWGPTMDQVESDFTDVLKQAGAGQGTIPNGLSTVQSKTIAAMKNQGLSVAGQ